MHKWLHSGESAGTGITLVSPNCDKTELCGSQSLVHYGHSLPNWRLLRRLCRQIIAVSASVDEA